MSSDEMHGEAQSPVEWLREQVEADLDRHQQVLAQQGIIAFEEEELAAARDGVADCEAKLAILDEYESRDKDTDLMLGPDIRRQREWSGLQLAMRLLLGAYRHREGWRPEWQSPAGFSLAALLPSPPTGRISIWPEAVTPVLAGIQEGHTVTMDGRDWRVAQRTEGEDGGITLELEVEGLYPEDEPQPHAASEDECADADQETIRALLVKHGYDPELPARGVAGPPGRFDGYKSTASGVVPTLLRSHVCELEGVIIDGHSDPDRSGLCIYCSKEMP